MKSFKNKFMMIFLCFFVIFSSILFSNNKVYANDEKLDKFIATSLDKGYLNSTIEITQISNHKYEVVFLIKENILGVNYGFYLTPAIVESLTKMGFECETIIDQQYAYNIFRITTNNLGEVATRLSILPYIDLEYYIDKDSKEQIFKGNFQEDFFKEERESNEMLNTLFNSNIMTVKFKPMSEQLFMSNASLKDDNGFYVWVSSQEYSDTDFSVIVNPVPIYIYIIIYTIVLAILSIIVYLIVYIVKKYMDNKYYNGRKSKNNNDEYNYNDYSDY